MEPLDTKDIQILLPICQAGGFGDIVAGAAIAEYFQARGISFQVAYQPDAEEKVKRIAGSNWKEWLKYDEQTKKLISICPVMDHRTHEQRTKSIATINIGEYDKYGQHTDLNNRRIGVKTGLGFQKDACRVEAGIYHRQGLEFLLNTADQSATSQESKRSLRKVFIEQIIKQFPWFNSIIERQEGQILNAGYSLFYPSTLSSRGKSFLTAVKKAESHLDKPLVIFGTLAEGTTPEIKKITEDLGLNYCSQSSPYSGNNPPNIMFVDLGTVNEEIFRWLVAMSDSTSLVTGDNSLSQMIQKANSNSPAPFFYEMAAWKYELGMELYRHMAKKHKVAAEILCSYIRSHSHYFMNDEKRKKKTPDMEMLARLFYDEKLIEGYNQGVRSIRESFIEERKEAGIKKAEVLWSINQTVGEIAQNLILGKNVIEATEDFVPNSLRAKVERGVPKYQILKKLLDYFKNL
jgi:hypothetical protein